jgi:hypothetical protein
MTSKPWITKTSRRAASVKHVEEVIQANDVLDHLVAADVEQECVRVFRQRVENPGVVRTLRLDPTALHCLRETGTPSVHAERGT